MAAIGPVQVDPAVGRIVEGGQRLAVDGMHDRALSRIGDAHDALARNGPDNTAHAGSRHRRQAPPEISRRGAPRPRPGVSSWPTSGGKGAATTARRGQLGRTIRASTSRPRRGSASWPPSLWPCRWPPCRSARRPRAASSRPQLDVAFAVDLAQVPPDRGLGAAGHGEGCRKRGPCGLRGLPLGGQDLDRLAVLQPGPQRHPQTVPSRAPTRNGRSACGSRRAKSIGVAPLGSLTTSPLGVEAEHPPPSPPLAEYHLGASRVFEKTRRDPRHSRSVPQAFEPACGIDGKGVLRAPHPALAIGPVRRDAGLGHLMPSGGVSDRAPPPACRRGPRPWSCESEKRGSFKLVLIFISRSTWGWLM